MLFFKPRSVPDDIRKALQDVVGPEMIENVTVSGDGAAIVTLLGDPALKAEMEILRQKVHAVASQVKGVKKTLVIVTAQRSEEGPSSFAPAKKPPAAAQTIPGIRQIIAVASGKGGVGKSTVAANLAIALSKTGKKVGLLDADIYGPSVPRLMGLSDKKPEAAEDGRIVPPQAHGIKTMSIGYMVAEEAPMIWRGPIVQSALLQMLRDVVWDDLDILVLDMPPGTGDIQLTIAQKVPLAGAVIVSTPQDLALIDARKGLEMFRKVAVPILGIVENMSYYLCPSCGHRENIFGTGGARESASNLGVPFLGEIPLHAKIRELSDLGTPVTAADPDSAQAKAFTDIASGVLENLETASLPAPKIVIEP
jgi:ATP-binding protein involved in chromosome partitioning